MAGFSNILKSLLHAGNAIYVVASRVYLNTNLDLCTLTDTTKIQIAMGSKKTSPDKLHIFGLSHKATMEWCELGNKILMQI